MQVKILTPEKTLFDSSEPSVEVSQVIVNAFEGKLGILENHCAMLAALQPGNIRVEVDGKWQEFDSNAGLVQVANNEVMILLNS